MKLENLLHLRLPPVSSLLCAFLYLLFATMLHPQPSLCHQSLNPLTCLALEHISSCRYINHRVGIYTHEYLGLTSVKQPFCDILYGCKQSLTRHAIRLGDYLLSYVLVKRKSQNPFNTPKFHFFLIGFHCVHI